MDVVAGFLEACEGGAQPAPQTAESNGDAEEAA